MSAGITVTRADILSASARSLIAVLNAELAAEYPEPGATHFRIDADEVQPGRGTFVIASLGRPPVGCGALRQIGDGVGELKRIFVVPHKRGCRQACA